MADACLPWTWPEESPVYKLSIPFPPCVQVLPVSLLPHQVSEKSAPSLKITRWCTLNLSVLPLWEYTLFYRPHHRQCGLLHRPTEARLWAEAPCVLEHPAPRTLPALVPQQGPSARAAQASQGSGYQYSVPASVSDWLCTARWESLSQTVYFSSVKAGCLTHHSVSPEPTSKVFSP